MTSVKLSDGVVFRSFGSETVLLNLATSQYHGLKGSGGRMLEVLVETGDVAETARRIADEYGQPLELITMDLDRMCAELVKRSLIEVDPAARG
jgi:hypothetical protein